MRIAKCIDGNQLKVVERGLSLFQNEFVQKVVTYYKDIIYPIIIPVLNNKIKNEFNNEGWIMRLGNSIEKSYAEQIRVAVDENLKELEKSSILTDK